MAWAVRSTSSPSSSPSMCVSPSASAPRISARWEIDLSPGARTRPFSGPPGWAVSPVSGMDFRLLEGGVFGDGVWVLTAPPPHGKGAARRHLEGAFLGQAGARFKADLPDLFRQVLRPRPPPRRLSQVRHRVRPGRGA